MSPYLWPPDVPEGVSLPTYRLSRGRRRSWFRRLYRRLHAMTTGAELIAAERQRQYDREPWSGPHDDTHREGELARAGAAYALAACPDVSDDGSEFWPWADGWKPNDDPVKNLVRAGALIAAEIDRLNRAAQRREEAA